MYGNRKKRRIYSVFMILLIFQLCFGMPGILSEEVYSDELDKDKLDIPGNIQTSATVNTIALKWNPVAEAESYDIEINGSVTEGIEVNEHIFEGLESNTEYVIRIRAANEEQLSEWSDPLVCKTFEAKNDALETNSDPENDITVTEYVYGVTEPVNPIPGEEQLTFDGNGLLGEYYNNISLTDLALRRIDHEINFDWGFESPDAAIKGNTFSVRWTGKVQPRYSGKYNFYTLANNGVRLWVNNKLIINNPLSLPNKESKGTIKLLAGEKYDIKMEYYEFLGKAKAVLSWSSKDQKKEVIPQSQLYSPLMAPDDIKAVPSITSISLKWNEAPGAQSYDIRFNNEMIDSIDSTEYMLENLAAGTEYNISIRSVYSFGTSDWSKDIKISTLEDQEAVQGNGNGLTGEYYDNIIFKKLIFKRVDRQINFDWGNGSPDPSMKKNTFSVRWKGKILPQYTAKYTIYLYSDDGAKLWINGKELIDYWKPHSSKEGSATIELIASEKYDIEIEYFNINKEAKIVLYWSNPYEGKTIIPMEQLYTKPDIPANVNITAEGSDIILSWDNTPGAETYELEADGAVIDNIADSQYVHKVLPNTEHKYRVRAVNEVSSGDWTEIFAKVSAPATPENLSAVADTTNIQISWDAVEAATGYDIEVDGNIIDNSSSTSYVHDGLNTNTKCTYRVRAKNENGAGAWTEMLVKTTLPDTPKNLVLDPASYAITLSWEDIPGAIGYDIEADGIVIDSAFGTAYIHKGLQPMTEHSYRIRAKSDAGIGYWSLPMSEITKVGVPENIDTISTSRTITFRWDPVTGAERYEIELDGVICNNDSETVYEYVDLIPNSAHEYRVRAINDIGNGDWSELRTKYTAPDIPGNIIAVSTSTSIELTWDAVEAAAEYDVEVQGTPIDNGNNTTYSQNGLNPNTQRTYRIRAKNENGIGDWSSIIAKSTLNGIPVNLSTVSTETSIKLLWDAVAGAAGYDVEADGVVFESILLNEYSLSDLAPNTSHNLRVRAKNEAGSGDWSALITAYTLPNAPTITAAEASETSIKIAWIKIDEVMSYDIEADGLIIDIGEANEFIHQNLLPNTEHIYRVRAKNGSSISSWSEAVKKLTLPDVPQNLSATATSSSVGLAWDKVEGAIKYEVEADGIVIAAVAENKYLHENLTPNKEHIYKVRARSEAGAGKWSEEARAFTLLGVPSNIKYTATSTAITLTWDEADGVDAYEIEADGAIFEKGLEIKYEHTSLMPNTIHLYRIRAKKAGATGAWSEYATAKTLLASVAEIKAVSTNTAIAFTWTPVGDAESYDVEADGNIVSGIIEPAYKLEGLVPNTPHTFKVMAKSAANTSDWSAVIIKYTAPDVPANIKTESTTSTIKTVWEAVYGAVGYDIEIDGAAIDNGVNLSYLHGELAPNTKHIYRVRAKNEHEVGPWSQEIAGTTEPELTFNCSEDSLFNFVIAAPKMEEIAERSITVTYNAEELEAVDLCAATAKQDIEIGEIQGTNLEVREFTPGTIVFSLKDPSKAIMNAVKFKAKINGQSKIIYVIE